MNSGDVIMKEKFDRSVPHRKITDIKRLSDITAEEKRANIIRTLTNISNIPIRNEGVKEAMQDKLLDSLIELNKSSSK